MSQEDYRAGLLAGYKQALKAAVDACESTCGKWHATKERTISGNIINECPCAEAVKKLEKVNP